jgi:addiction module HigA family antidote
MEIFNPVHPGVILRAYMGGSVTVTALAAHTRIPRGNLSMILNGRLGISAAIALKLSEAFPNSDAQMWLNLQNQFDLAKLRKKKRARIAPLLQKAA